MDERVVLVMEDGKEDSILSTAPTTKTHNKTKSKDWCRENIPPP
jgi:hypothetical protein